MSQFRSRKNNLRPGGVQLYIQNLSIDKSGPQSFFGFWWREEEHETAAARAEQFATPRPGVQTLAINGVNFRIGNSPIEAAFGFPGAMEQFSKFFQWPILHQQFVALINHCAHFAQRRNVLIDAL